MVARRVALCEDVTSVVVRDEAAEDKVTWRQLIGSGHL